MGKVGLGLIKFAFSLVGSAGSILLILGFFYLLSNGAVNLIALGVALSVVGEAGDIFIVQFDEKKNLEMFKLNFWNLLGSNYALPIILLIIYFLTTDKFALAFTVALAAQAAIRTASMVIKLKYIEDKVSL